MWTGSTGRAMSTPLSLPKWRWGPPTSGILRGGESDRKPACSAPDQPTAPPAAHSLLPHHLIPFIYQSHCQEPSQLSALSCSRRTETKHFFIPRSKLKTVPNSVRATSVYTDLTVNQTHSEVFSFTHCACTPHAKDRRPYNTMPVEGFWVWLGAFHWKNLSKVVKSLCISHAVTVDQIWRE